MTQFKEATSSFASDVPDASTSYSTPQVFARGTGESIHKNVILPAILDAKQEVILATCFWAPSETLNNLSSTLKQLSSKVIARTYARKVKVFICFSSRSATQKLFHTSSPDGYIYPSDEWPKKLGLPLPETLPGLEIIVKSLFLRPFSVLHSKYIIVDRRMVFLPSCNVSWEDWYECVIGLSGPVVRHVVEFWSSVWKLGGIKNASESAMAECVSPGTRPESIDVLKLSGQPLKTTLLPHPYDASLRQAIWFLSNDTAPMPRSALNVTLLRLISQAKTEVIMLTPNFTSMPAFTAVACALLRGIPVHLTTNRRMMVPEQLATAGVLTEQFVDRLIKEYRRGFSGQKMQRRLLRLRDVIGSTAEDASAKLGKLRVSYFSPPIKASSTSSELDTELDIAHTAGLGTAALADKSHIKLTLVDRRAIVLGSGNMDRASWRTSQELGILIEETEKSDGPASQVQMMWNEVERGLQGCLEHYFVS